MLTQERLKELFQYDPETGDFIKLKSGRGRNNKVGDIAKCLESHGYIQIGIDYKNYLAHRLAVLYMTGKFPENEVDHIDGIKNNNKWLNLREATHSQNQQNLKKAMKNNKSTGLLGVYPNNNKGFQSVITLNGKPKCLGTFKTKDEAYQVYINAKRNLHEFNTI